MNNKLIYSKCADYTPEKVDQSIEFIINNLENFKEKLTKAKTVLIKPNLLSAKTPEKAVTTHPEVIKSIINKIKEYNVEIIIADTPAGKLDQKIMEKVYTETQMHRVAQETGTQLNRDFTEFIASSQNNKIAKSYKIMKVVEDADLIINVAKLKTHCFTMITTSTKNLYGTIPGLLKMQYHMTMSKREVFNNMLLDLERYFAPKTISFIDGIVGMEGNGPSNGDPISSKCIIASNSAPHLDVLACHIMGVNPNDITTMVEAKKRNIIHSLNIKDFEIVKDSEIETLQFQLPPDRGKMLPDFVPEWGRNLINKMIITKPTVKASDCIACKKCEEICPPQLIKVKNKKAFIDDYNKCIRCYCCQEVCPVNAIKVTKPIGRKILEKI